MNKNDQITRLFKQMYIDYPAAVEDYFANLPLRDLMKALEKDLSENWGKLEFPYTLNYKATTLTDPDNNKKEIYEFKISCFSKYAVRIATYETHNWRTSSEWELIKNWAGKT